MKSNYSFLARNQKTESERQRNNIDDLWGQLGSMGFVGKTSFYTGAGEDGVVQPNRPTGILSTSQGPKTVHEGEPVNVAQDGSFSVTPAASFADNNQGTATGYTPATQVGGQERLEKLEKTYDMEGYAVGTPDQQIDDITSKAVQTRGLQRLERYAEGNSPLEISAMNAERERFAGEAATAVGSASQELSQAGVTGREAATEQAMLKRSIGAQENEMMQGLRSKQIDRGFTAASQLPGAATTAMSEDRLQRGLEFNKQQWADTEGQRMLEDAVTMGEESWLATHPDKTAEDYKIARDQAVLTQRQVSLSEQQWKDTEGERMLSDAITMSEGTWLLKHPGTSPKDYQTARDQATLQQKAQQLNESRFDQERIEYQDSNVWKGYEAAIIAGDFVTASEKYYEVTGNYIDMDKMIEYQNYLDKKQQQELLSGDLQLDAQALGISADRLTAFINAVNSGADLTAANSASGLDLNNNQFEQIQRDYSAAGEEQRARLDSLKNTVGQEKYDSIMNRIGTGASLDMINSEFDTKLSAQDFMSMRETTGYGQTLWERKLTGANMLMQTQDPINIEKAAEMYEDIFPGIVDFDVRELIKSIGTDKFTNGLSDMATVAATFDTWDEALTTITNMRLFENMNITEKDAQDLFNSLKINQIDEEWSAIEDSDFYKSLLDSDPDTAKLIQDTFSAGLSGELEFDITPVYNITDENGRFVDKFDNVEDAEAFITENASKEYSMEEGKNYVYKNITTGDTVVVNNNTGEATGEGETKSGLDFKDEAWTDFQASMGGLPDSEWPSYTEFESAWEEAGMPKSFTISDYRKIRGEPTSINALKGLDALVVKTPDELLQGTNSKTVLDAWKQDKAVVRKSDYYFKDFPKTSDLEAATTTVPTGRTSNRRTGAVSTSKLSDEMTTTLKAGIGKIIETKDVYGNKVEGQLVSFKITSYDFNVDSTLPASSSGIYVVGQGKVESANGLFAVVKTPDGTKEYQLTDLKEKLTAA